MSIETKDESWEKAPFDVRFTPLGMAFAKAKATPEDVIKEAINEIVSGNGIDDRPLSIDTLIFHTFEVNGCEFIMYPINNGKVLEIDTCSRDEDGEALEEGPFKGYKISVPSGDSERSPPPPNLNNPEGLIAGDFKESEEGDD